jgi:hypothetical protein
MAGMKRWLGLGLFLVPAAAWPAALAAGPTISSFAPQVGNQGTVSLARRAT